MFKVISFVVIGLLLSTTVCADEVSDSFISEVDNENMLRIFYRKYPEIIYLIQKNNRKAYELGITILTNLYDGTCVADERLFEKMHRGLAEALVWNEGKFFEIMENQSNSENIIKIYKACYRHIFPDINKKMTVNINNNYKTPNNAVK